MVLSHLIHTQETHQNVWKGRLEASEKSNISPEIMPLERESPSVEVIYPEKDNTLLDIAQDPHYLNNTLSDAPTFSEIRARIQQRFKCKAWCSCICHKRTRLQTASGLNSVIGKLSIQQNGVPFMTAPCDNIACKKRTQNYSQTLVKFEYRFPRWLLKRILVFSIACKCQLRPELLLRVQRVRPGNDPLFDLVWRGDIEGVQKILDTGKGSVLDLKAGNLWSALHVRQFKKRSPKIMLI